MLALLAECPSEALGASEVARRLGLHKSTCHNILSALSEAGLLARSEDDKTYTLGPALIGLGEAARRGMPLLRQAQPLIGALSASLGYGAWLSALEGETLQTLDAVPDPRARPLRPRVGRRHPFTPPFGAALVAFADPDAQERWIARAGVDDDETRRLRRMLGRVRRAGLGIWRLDQSLELVAARMEFATSWLEPGARDREPGFDPTLALYFTDMGDRIYSLADLSGPGHGSVSTMAAPVFDDTATARFELGLAVFEERLSFRAIRRAVAQLLETALRLTEAAGGTPPDDWPPR